MDETLEQRLAAVERALTDGNHDLSALATSGDIAHRLDEVESDLDTLADRVAELEAATQALRGYVGNVRAVNREVERRADAALAAVESSHPPSENPDNGEPAAHSTEMDDASSPENSISAAVGCEEDHCPRCGTLQTTEEDLTPTDPSTSDNRSGHQATTTPAGSNGAAASARNTMEAVTETDGGVPGGSEGEAPSLLSRVRERL